MPIPVIVGVGDLRDNRERLPTGGLEPSALMLAATRLAAMDAGLPLEALRELDLLLTVDQRTWAYRDLPGLLAGALGATPAEGWTSPLGGNQPVALVDHAAARIAAGEARLALVTGAEAIASVSATYAGGLTPAWSTDRGGLAPLDMTEVTTPLAARYGLAYPTRIYPLWEQGLRARLGLSHAANQRWTGEMFAEMSRVASANPASWNPTPLTPDEILASRMICWPYPLLVNALIAVNQGAAVIVADRDWALEQGLDPSTLICVVGGAQAEDPKDILQRSSYSHSPGLTDVLGWADALAPDAYVDLYSCFPCVPKLALEALGTRDDASTTVTGGLTAFGGPGNDYSLHAIAAMTRRLREEPGDGIVYGNGEFLTKHASLVLSASPGPYAGRDGIAHPRPDAPPVDETLRGEATVETFTVELDRAGAPRDGTVIALAQGRRTPAWVDDPGVLAWLTDPTHEPVGQVGTLTDRVDGRTGFAL